MSSGLPCRTGCNATYGTTYSRTQEGTLSGTPCQQDLAGLKLIDLFSVHTTLRYRWRFGHLPHVPTQPAPRYCYRLRCGPPFVAIFPVLVTHFVAFNYALTTVSIDCGHASGSAAPTVNSAPAGIRIRLHCYPTPAFVPLPTCVPDPHAPLVPRTPLPTHRITRTHASGLPHWVLTVPCLPHNTDKHGRPFI